MSKILIVDDSSTMRKIIMRSLRQAELKVEEIFEAANGLEALEQLTKNTDIDLVFSDVNMPEMNGLDLVRKIRETKDSAALPIVMVTTESGGKSIQEAMDCGANGYVCKPFTPDSIREAVSKIG